MKPATRGPLFACLYPGMCDVARHHGYALALHGSLIGDMDLIAVPWSVDSADAETLKDALMDHIGACGYSDLLERDAPWLTKEQRLRLCSGHRTGIEGSPEEKPHGRLAWNLYLWAGTKVDLSVLPKVISGPPPEPDSEILDALESLLGELPDPAVKNFNPGGEGDDRLWQCIIEATSVLEKLRKLRGGKHEEND